jgi:membrane fusion protein (multidrug efflux system)
VSVSLFRAPRVALFVALFLALAAALLGCKPKQAPSTEAPVETISVQTVDVREQPMPRSLKLTGTLRGSQQTDLAANAFGRVLATYVERGSEVKKGQRLALLDVRSAAASAAEARSGVALASAQADAAKRECERYAKLLEQNVISAAEHDRISDGCRTSALSVQVAQARAQTVGLMISDGTIAAPFAGVVTQRHVNAGEYVRSDSKVVTLVNLDSLRLELTVPEASFAAVKEGGALTFTVPSYPDRTFAGTVRFIGGTVRETTRDLVAEAVVDNEGRALRPGMFATVALLTGETPALVLPRSALVAKEDGRTHVFAVVDRRIEERVVQTGAAKGDVVAIVQGVKSGDKVVLAPTETLRNGQAVN